MKLKMITFKQSPRLAGLRTGDTVSLDLDAVPAPLIGWNILLRGSSIILVSPPGWNNRTQTQPHLRDKNGPCVVHVIPGNEAYLQWEAEAGEIDAVTKSCSRFETGPIGAKPVLVDEAKTLLAQIPPGQVGDA